MSSKRDWFINTSAVAGIVLIAAGLQAWLGWPSVAVLLGSMFLGGAVFGALR